MKRICAVSLGGGKLQWFCPYCKGIFGAHPKFGSRCKCGARVLEKGWIEPAPVPKAPKTTG
jgi:hypothetical protein